MNGSLILVTALGLFPSVGLPCPALMYCFLLYLVIFYFVVFGCYLLKLCSFLMKDRNGVDAECRGDEEELGGTEGGEIITRI